MAVFGVDSFEAVQKTFQLVRKHCSEILSAFEFLDHQSFDVVQSYSSMNLRNPFESRHPMYVLIETSGSNKDHDDAKLQALLEDLLESDVITDGVLAQDETQVKALWSLREGVPEALGHYGKVYKYDISMPIEKMYELVETLRARMVEKKLMPAPQEPGRVKAVCGYGHVGDGTQFYGLRAGNLHINVVAEAYDAEIEAAIEPFIYEWIQNVECVVLG